MNHFMRDNDGNTLVQEFIHTRMITSFLDFNSCMFSTDC